MIVDLVAAVVVALGIHFGVDQEAASHEIFVVARLAWQDHLTAWLLWSHSLDFQIVVEVAVQLVAERIADQALLKCSWMPVEAGQRVDHSAALA